MLRTTAALVAVLLVVPPRPALAEEDLGERAFPLCEALLKLKLAEPESYRLLTEAVTEKDPQWKEKTFTETTFAFRATRHGDLLAGVYAARCRLAWEGPAEDLGAFVRVVLLSVGGTIIPKEELPFLSAPLRLLDAASE